ncbi:DUF3618 domain-containing protein [Thalassiella azotivora]
MATTPEATNALPDDPAAIQAAIRARQEHLARTVDELQNRLSPKEVARRAKDTAQERAQQAVTAEDGSLRTERIAAVGAAVAGLLAIAVVRKARR